MNKEKIGIPKLRFPGFTDPWEQRKLGEVFNQTSVIINPEIDNVELWSLTIEDGLTRKTDRYNRQFLVKKNDNFKKVFPGDIVYNPMNMTLGAVGFNYMKLPVAVSGYYVTMKLNEKYDNRYFVVWLKSPIALALYKRYATGSLTEKQRVQFSTLSTIPVVIPTYKEQQKIGSFFKRLDSLIALHQRKLEHLKQQKNGLLQKMFPKNGESVPEVRFPGFTDSWEQRRLGEILNERSERSSEGELISVTINSGVVKANSLDRKDNSSSDKSNYKVVKRNDIAYNSMRMWQGASGFSPYDGILSPAYTVLIPTKEVDSKFISYMFKKEKMLQQFQRYSQGLTSDTWNLKYPMLKNIPAILPGLTEQVKIRSILEQFDSLIALHQRKLEHLELLKKGLLQQMFV